MTSVPLVPPLSLSRRHVAVLGRHLLALLLVTSGAGRAVAVSAQPVSTPARPAGTQPRTEAKPQPRPHGARVAVPPALLSVDDGDTVVVRWPGGDVETVRLLGIDTPETRHLEHNLPYGQPFGEEARAFLAGVLAATTQAELLRSRTLDPYGRTLGYLFVNGRNYSVLVVSARLAAESITQFGDNGLPAEAAEVMRAAKAAGPLPFEAPGAFRARMREVTRWMKERGIYPSN
jgi:endonuclease YncB( thermonuclease family)